MTRGESAFWRLLFGLMQERGFTQTHTAERIGVTTATLQNWRTKPWMGPENAAVRRRICKLFGIPRATLDLAIEAGQDAGYVVPKPVWLEMVEAFRKSPAGRDLPADAIRRLRRARRADLTVAQVQAVLEKIDSDRRR